VNLLTPGRKRRKRTNAFWLWPLLPHYRTARVMGGLVLVLGLALTTLANLP
jgi:hypothetical protein